MLKEVLLKKEKGEDLTEEELNLIKEYEDSLIEINSKLKLLEDEKILNTKKFEATNEELQNTVKELARVSSELETTKSEKESFMKLLDDEKSSTAIKEELAKLETEKKLKLEQENRDKQNRETITRYENSLKTLQEEMNKIKSQNEIMNFKYTLSKKKEEYPYLEKEIQSILEGVDEKGIELSNSILEFLIKSKNHDEEMKKYLAIKQAGSSIFDNKGKIDNKDIKKEDTDPKYARFKGLNVELMKEYGFVSRR